VQKHGPLTFGVRQSIRQRAGNIKFILLIKLSDGRAIEYGFQLV